MLVKQLSKIRISNSFTAFVFKLLPFEFHFHNDGQPNHDITFIAVLCQMPRFVIDHTCMDCCQQWPRTCSKSGHIANTVRCGGRGVDD